MKLSKRPRPRSD